MSDMTPSEIARAMASYIRKHGFSPYLSSAVPGCGCFVRASPCAGAHEEEVALKTVCEVIGSESLGTLDLIDSGWTAGCTDYAPSPRRHLSPTPKYRSTSYWSAK